MSPVHVADLLTAANLVALLGWWRESTDPALARAIELCGPHAARGVTVEGAWHVAVNRADLVERHHLIVTLGESDRDERVARIEALARFTGRDPRVDLALLAYVLWGSHGVTDTARMRIVEHLDRTRDGRVLAQIPALELAVRRYGVQTQKRLRKIIGRIRANHARIEARPLSDDERAFVDAVIAEATRVDARDAEIEAALLAAVYAAPHDDAPRSVYADWLMERQDPRGEFIALQLAQGEAAPRAKQLYEAHHRTWLGPFFDQRAGLRFRRGFLARSYLQQSENDHPMLATLEHCAHLPPPPARRTVRVISSLYDDEMVRIGELPPDAMVEELGWYGTADSPRLAEVRAAYAAAPLPALRDLTVRAGKSWARATWTPDDCAWMLRDRALRSVSIEGSPTHLPRWIGLFAPTTVEGFTLVDGSGAELAVSRDPANRFTRVALSSTSARVTSEVELVARGLATCPPDSLTQFTLTTTPAITLAAPERDLLVAALASQPRVRFEVP